IRDSSYIDSRFVGNLSILAFRTIPLTIFIAIMLIAVYELIVKNEQQYIHWTIFNLFLEIISFGGRAGVWKLLWYLILTVMIYGLKIKKSKLRKYIIFLIMIL